MGNKYIIGDLYVNDSKVVTEDTLPESSDFSGSYNDLTDKPTIPDALSDLSEDATHRTVTDTEKSTWNAKSNFSGSYNDLTGKPTIPTVPTKVSAFENDSKYITEEVFNRKYSEGLSYTLSNNEYKVSGIGTCTDTDIVIPAIYNEKHVTSIGYGAFDGCISLTSVIIPDSVTSIGDYAFSGCSSLMSITIPGSITSISLSTFSGCSSLTSVTIGEGVTSIGHSAFLNCSKLTSITIPDSVTSIDEMAFYGCSNLTSVTIPDSVTTIGGYAFGSCNILTIYCEVESKPDGWATNWNPKNRPVVWDFAPDLVSVNEKIGILETELKAYIDETFLGGTW